MSVRTAGREEAIREASSPRSPALWFGLLAPPLAWAANLVLGDLVFELGCAAGVRGAALYGVPLRGWSLIQSAVMAAVAVAAGVVAWRAWRTLCRAGDEPRVQRARAMAVAGVASAALYLGLIVYGVLPPLLLSACARVP